MPVIFVFSWAAVPKNSGCSRIPIEPPNKAAWDPFVTSFIARRCRKSSQQACCLTRSSMFFFSAASSFIFIVLNSSKQLYGPSCCAYCEPRCRTMKASTLALSVLLAAADPFAAAFAPASFTRSVRFSSSNQVEVANFAIASSRGQPTSSQLNLSSSSGFLDEDDEDEDGTLLLRLLLLLLLSGCDFLVSVSFLRRCFSNVPIPHPSHLTTIANNRRR